MIFDLAHVLLLCSSSVPMFCWWKRNPKILLHLHMAKLFGFRTKFLVQQTNFFRLRKRLKETFFELNWWVMIIHFAIINKNIIIPLQFFNKRKISYALWEQHYCISGREDFFFLSFWPFVTLLCAWFCDCG